jgi:putative zinc finger/helix-turn-helix YgiT family protein
MATVTAHECGPKTREEFLATAKKPFQFVDSGLSNVYLVGIRYFVCDCGKVVAEIPAIKQLLSLIARDLVEKSKALAPEEIRFLRKRLGKKQSDFAREIGVRGETLSRFENGQTRANERTDKLIRLYYVLMSKDPQLADIRSAIEEVMSQWKHSSMPAKIVATMRDNEWKAEVLAA